MMSYLLDSDKTWLLEEADAKSSKTLARESGLSLLSASFLVKRGIYNACEAKTFLNPTSGLQEDPAVLPDIKKATQRIKQAIKNSELIYIHGDYDVDGITSTTLLYSILKKMKANVRYHIPCRFSEGYGLNKKSLNKIIKEGAKLLITVDCGIKSFSEVNYAKKRGLDVVITDHHEPAKKWPSALAVVNPKLPHSDSNNREIAGVGVSLKLAQMLADDSLDEYYDLVALGTVADIAPLLNENRYFAKKGLSLFNKKNRLGLERLAEVAGIKNRKVTSETLGYILAPRLNASGRVSNANICVELLLTRNENRAHEIAQLLDNVNKKRQQIEKKMLKEVMEKLEQEYDEDKEKVIFLASEDFHDGIKGIIASRIKEKYSRPTFIGTIKDGKIKASARSIPKYSIHKALESISDCLLDFGGHEKAGALTVSKDKVSVVKQKLNDLADIWLDEDDIRPKVIVEAKLALEQLDDKLRQELEKMEPFGEGNRKPKVLLEDVYLKKQKRLGKEGSHLKLGLYKNGVQIDALAFNVDAFSTVLNHSGKADIVGVLDLNTYNLRTSFQLIIDDLKLYCVKLDSPKKIVDHLFANREALAKKEEYKNIGDAESFYTKLVGVTFNGRQDTINRLKVNSLLELKREAKNTHDPNAIRVFYKNEDLGFLNKRLAKQVAFLMDNGEQFECRVTDITGGGRKKFGVNVKVKRTALLNPLENYGEQKKFVFKNKEEALAKIKKCLIGQAKFHKFQEEALSSLLSNKVILTIMGTGRGKSAIFQTIGAYKSLVENKMSVFLYPLRSLIADQNMFLKDAFAKIGLNVVRLSGDCSLTEREKIFAAMNKGKIDIILTTPEFLFHNIVPFSALKNKIGFLVVDEAHHLKTASKAHRPLYKELDSVVEKLGNCLLMAATATADSATCNKITKTLGIEEVIIDPTVRKNLSLIDKREISNKEIYIKNLIDEGRKIIVYVNSREKVAEIANNLRMLSKDAKEKIVYYHAGLGGKLRSAVQNGFANSEFRAVVATSAFGEGINIADVSDIVLYHMPFSFVEYNQQSGRCGRDGNKAQIHLIYGEDDARINELILGSKAPGRDTLSTVWRVLTAMEKNKERLEVSTAEINSWLKQEQQLNIGINNQAIAQSLKIFEELGLINSVSRRKNEESLAILINKGQKVDLSNSLIYEEGLHEKEEFQEFKQWALNALNSELLNKINQPIYPKELIIEEKAQVLEKL